MRRLRVAIVVPGFVRSRDEPGMAAVVDLVEWLAARVDLRVTALRHPPNRASWELAGARVEGLGLGRARGPGGRARVLAAGIAAVVRAHRRSSLDVVHGLWADEPGAIAALAGRLIGRPSVVSVMGGELAAMPDIRYGAALGRGGRWTVAAAMRLADLLTTGSTAMLEVVRERRRGRPVAWLPLGVDTTAFAPRAGSATGAPPTLLFAAALEPVKDPLLLLRSFGRLAATRPELRLMVAGDGRLRPELERQAGLNGLAERVRFLGDVPRPELLDRYRSAAVLVVTSRHEGQSMVAVEAAACGLPIIGTRVGVLPDLGDGARLVPAADSDLAEAIGDVIDDPVLRTKMSVAGRTVAVERFDLDRTAADLLAVYEALAGSRSIRSD
jgi:glycosyltransferase involved in cell wall biosynthesis